MRRLLGAAALLVAFSGAPASDASDASVGPSILERPLTETVAVGGILTPVPIRLALPAAMKPRRVLVHYRLWGNEEWTTLELTRRGEDRWDGAIPCLEVSTVTGDLVYYVRMHDTQGNVIAYSGSRHRPYRVRIVHPTERPDVAAGKCPDPSDCPPGVPGCPSERVTRVPCNSDADCEGGRTCGWDGFCEDADRKLNWLSLEIEQGSGIVWTAGACSVPSQESEGYVCRRQFDGETYVGSPVHTNEPVAVGPTPTRVLVGYERVFFYGSSVGIRAGYAFRGEGPTPNEGTDFFPYSVEVRVAKWFGADPFAGAEFRSFVFAAAGAGMWDVPFSMQVREDPSVRAQQGSNDLEQTLDVWKRAGDAYAGIGAGCMLPVSHATGPSVEIGLYQAFPFGATLIVPRLGWRAGF